MPLVPTSKASGKWGPLKWLAYYPRLKHSRLKLHQSLSLLPLLTQDSTQSLYLLTAQRFHFIHLLGQQLLQGKHVTVVLLTGASLLYRLGRLLWTFCSLRLYLG